MVILIHLLYLKGFLCVFNGSEYEHVSLYLKWFTFSSHVFICPSLKVMLRKENCFIDYHSNLLSRLLEHGSPEALLQFTELKPVDIGDFTCIIIAAKPISCSQNPD